MNYLVLFHTQDRNTLIQQKYKDDPEILEMFENVSANESTYYKEMLMRQRKGIDVFMPKFMEFRFIFIVCGPEYVSVKRTISSQVPSVELSSEIIISKGS